MILFVNACVRIDSRTNRIAAQVLEILDGDIKEVKLSDIRFTDTIEDFLRKRDGYIASKDYSDPYFDLAKQFANAQIIVIAAPYWDLSFPAVLKQYIEHINVRGVTF